MEQSSENELVIVTALLFSFSALIVVLRFISRWLSAAKFWWDDAFMALSLIMDTGVLTVATLGANLGVGHHIKNLSEDQITKMKKTIYAAAIYYPLQVTAVKSSVLFFYLRVFGVRRPFKIIIFAVQGFMTAWCIITVFLGIFQTNPISAYWDPNRPLSPERARKYHFVVVVPNVIMDFTILAMPAPLVWQLQMPQRRKLFLCGVFLLGGLACAASIVRAYILTMLDQHGITYATRASALWSVIEINIGIISASLPVLGPLLRTVFSILSSSCRSKTSMHSSWPQNSSRPPQNATTASRAPFSKIKEESIRLPANRDPDEDYIHSDLVRGGHRIVEGQSQPIPLNAICVRHDVEIGNFC